MDTAIVAALPPNTLGMTALIFLVLAWSFVLGVAFWSYRKLMSTPREEKLPPPGSIP